MPIPDGPGWHYDYSNVDGTCTSITDQDGNSVPLSWLKPWPPPFKGEDPKRPLSGDPPEAIGWRKAELTMLFICTDVAHACSFTPGYRIPPTLQARPMPGAPWTTVPTIAFSAGSRYGYLDDLNHPNSPPNAFTLSDIQTMLFAMPSLVVIGCPNNGVIPSAGPVPASSGGASRWCQAVSALSGAGVELGLPYQGHVLPISHAGADADGNAMFAVADAYAQARGVHKVDFAFICDNTGSMGSSQSYFKSCVAQCAQRLLDAGYDSYFAYCTFADFPANGTGPWPGSINGDWPAWISAGSADDGDTSFQVRYPFSALTPTTAAQFAALSVPGQGGGDGPEDGLEALGRVLLGKARVLGPLDAGAISKFGMRHDPTMHMAPRGAPIVTGR